MADEDAKLGDARSDELTDLAAERLNKQQTAIPVGSVSASWDEDPKRIADSIRKGGAQ